MENYFEFAKDILNIDSPSGYCEDVIKYIEDKINKLGYKTTKTNKGNLEIYIDGLNHNKTIGLCAHADTLGLMVRSINSDGTLIFTNVGGPIVPTLDGEYCRIITRDKKVYTGTILSLSPAAHVYEDAKNRERSCETMSIRIDEKIKSKADVEALGISNGDYIAIETKTQVTRSGFIKSRFLDDKISVAIIYDVLKQLKENHIIPAYDMIITISTYEEVGHGSSYINPKINELLAVDMGCIGKDLECSEYDVSICAKDASGPYDYGMTTKLINLSKENNLQYAVDIYPFYSSDASAALRAGQNIRAALIGPGVHASHGMERTHKEAIENTIKLIMLYIKG